MNDPPTGDPTNSRVSAPQVHWVLESTLPPNGPKPPMAARLLVEGVKASPKAKISVDIKRVWMYLVTV